MGDEVEELVTQRAANPQRITAALASRRRRTPVLGPHDTLLLIAADHPARGQLRVGDDQTAMADRADLLRRLLAALDRPGVDGLMATADIVEDLALLGALDEKVVFGSMNRGGLAGSTFELDDSFTGYTATAIRKAGLDGGKMMLRIDDDDPGTLRTLSACARAVDDLADSQLPAMLEVFATERVNGRVTANTNPHSLTRAVAVASGIGSTSAYTWLKIPAHSNQDAIAASTLPTFLLGGDPNDTDVADIHDRWRRAMAYPQVRGLVVGRTLLYPPDGDIAGAVDTAARVIAEGKQQDRVRQHLREEVGR